MEDYSVDVIIEVPYQSNIKYEYDNSCKRIRCDRVLKTSMMYPGNYGYIENTLSGDGDPLDVLVLSNFALCPNTIIKCTIISVLETEDEKGMDEKIIAIPHESVDDTLSHMDNVDKMPESYKSKITHFFETYKKTDVNKWTRIGKFLDRDEALKIYHDSLKHNRDSVNEVYNERV